MEEFIIAAIDYHKWNYSSEEGRRNTLGPREAIIRKAEKLTEYRNLRRSRRGLWWLIIVTSRGRVFGFNDAGVHRWKTYEEYYSDRSLDR